MLKQLLGIMWAKNHDYLVWNGLFRNAFRSQWWTWNLLQTFSVASSHCNNKLLYFCNVFTQDNSLFCNLNNVMLQACVLGKLLLATKPTKTVVMGKQALEGFLHHHPPFVSTKIFSTYCCFLRAHTAVPLLLVRHSAMLLKIQAAAKSRIRIAPQPSVFRNTS